MRSFNPLLAVVLSGLLPAAFVVGGLPSPAAADYASDCASPTRVLTGGSSSALSIATGEVVLLTGGSFTGGVNEFPGGATFCVAADTTFAPPYVNNAAGTLAVRGTATLPGMSVNAGFELANEGRTTLSGTFNENGTTTLGNAAGADLVASVPFTLSGGSTLTNAGTMTAPSVTSNSNTTFVNDGVLKTDQLIVSGPVRNQGQIVVDGSFTTDGGGTVDNSCLIDVASGWQANDRVHNSGLITLRAGRLVNQGTLEQTSTGQIQGADFTNNSQVTGFGRYRFTGDTRTQNRFAGDSSSDPILFWDTTSGGGIFDGQSGTVTNLVRAEVEEQATPDCGGTPPVPADLQVTKTGPATVAPNGTVTYTVTVGNLGPGPANEVVVTDTLPAELTDVTASEGGTVAGGKVTWTLGPLAAEETRTFTITGTAPGSGTFENVVAGTSGGPDPDETNNDGTSESARVTTTVDSPPPPANHPPVADDVTETIDVNGTAGGTVPVSDPDQGQEIGVTLLGEPSNGTATVAPDGSFVYQPAPDFTGRDTFTVRPCDNGVPVLCDTATVTVVVRPLAQDDHATTDQDVPVTIDVEANDSGTTTDPAVVANPANGTVAAGPDGSQVYTPDAGFTGTDTFTYEICAPAAPGVCDTAVVTVTVTPVNHPPRIGNDEFTVPAGTAHAGRVDVSDPDVGQQVTVTPGDPLRHGTVEVSPDGAYSYQPSPGFAGNDTFTLIACDDGEPRQCATGRVVAHITPVAGDDSGTTPRQTPVTIAIGDNDLGTVGPPAITGPPEHGSVEVLPSGEVRYAPADGFTGVDQFTYRICADGAPDLRDTGVVTITVTGGAEPGPGPSPTPSPTSTPAPNPTSAPDDPGGHASGTEDGLPHTGADGLGAVMIAFVAITALAVLCLIVGFRVSRREEE